MRTVWRAVAFVAMAALSLVALITITGFAPIVARRAAVSQDAMQPCCLDSGPLQCTGICTCPRSGANLLDCHDFPNESPQQIAQGWGVSDNSGIVNPLTISAGMGGNEGCTKASQVTYTDAGMVLTVDTYDGGPCPWPFDAGTSLTPTSYAAEVWSRKTFTPPFTWCFKAIFPDAGGTSGAGACGSGICTDPSIFYLDAKCHPNPDGGAPASIGAANYPPYSPGNGCVESNGSLLDEGDPTENYGPGNNTSAGGGGPAMMNHSRFLGASDTINALTFTSFDVPFVWYDQVNPGTNDVVYWNGTLKDTITSQPPSATVFLIGQNRGFQGLKGPHSVTWIYSKVVSGIHSSCD